MAALVSLSAGGAITGFSFVPKAAADISSPTSMPLNLVALRQSVQSPQADRSAPGHDAMPEQDPGRDGSDHLAARQHRRR
jgi:hypothetical protein